VIIQEALGVNFGVVQKYGLYIIVVGLGAGHIFNGLFEFIGSDSGMMESYGLWCGGGAKHGYYLDNVKNKHGQFRINRRVRFRASKISYRVLDVHISGMLLVLAEASSKCC
jgi:hypothetical protein